MSGSAVPRATYRVQLNQRFGFRAAAELVRYLARLGISHCYFSPYLKTRPGSEHGYDVTDHSKLNPELGEPADYDALCARLAEHDMGQIADVVPNHIGIMGADGRWWLSVLEHGQASRFADYFDIDWRPVTPKLRDKVLVPVLGDQYGNVLLKGDLKLELDERRGDVGVRYYEHWFPLDPASYPLVFNPGRDSLPTGNAADRVAAIELESILRALQALPPHNSTGAAECQARHDETVVAKRRLAELTERSPAVAEHLRRSVAALNGIAGERASHERLHELLERQPYRLAYWRVAADEINYRRFFDINDLAGLRTQNFDVLEATHGKLLEWTADGRIHGWRIDHPDGLYDPLGYLEWLRARLGEVGRAGLYVVVEKILAAHEHLPRGWPVQGTTGYDFANAVNGLFVFGAAEQDFDRVYRTFTREREPFESMLYQCKQQILAFHLSSELTLLAHLLYRLAESRLETRDFTLNEIRSALLELVSAFPVYRSYVTPEHIGRQDRRHIEWAVKRARQSYGSRDDGLLDFVRTLLLGQVPDDAAAAYRAHAAEFAGKFQQVTGPVMAKALEDTCFYRYIRLLSLNEVGSDPRRFGITPAAFHRQSALRLRHWPHSMLGTSTHDSKRSEDVRARLNVLSEIPFDWETRIAKWRRFNRAKRHRIGGRPVPSRSEEYLFYQTLVGSWPVVDRADAMPEYRSRISAYMIKALREAKINTSWAKQSERYERLVSAFVSDVLSNGASRNPFLDDLDEFVRSIAMPGFLNSLGQTLLKLTSPGVPDIYQGNEVWDFSLVDPDNRRPVDYARRAALLEEIEEVAADTKRIPALLDDMLANLADGRAKLYATWRALRLRAERPELFELGSYTAIEPRGSRAEHLCALARRYESVRVVAVVGRWFASLPRSAGAGPASFDWLDTTVALAPGVYRDVFSEVSSTVEEGAGARVGELLARFPIALLVCVDAT
jgi:(1->4)-alpha-D-glucan 1-alpha-D-glucosylmutase